ncbi:hypothetical protein RB653_003093 [Dictyostelium firmibasis]|uniref:ATP synthase subunit d, mitochondrial n=1 Tax=Dictyostelium firmibasis TaxID=79012 RepID=A0AAN7TZD2_9MYCE
MFRYSLRVLSKVDIKATEAVVATPKSSFNYPAYLKQYFEGSDSLPPVPQREQFQKETDYINAVVTHPVLSKSPNALKYYNEYMDTKRARANYDPLPGYEDKPIDINWDFYKKILPEDTVNFFQALEKKTQETIKSWAEEDKKYIDFALKKIKADQEGSKDFRETIISSIKAVEADKQEMENFLANLRTTTFDELHGKYPEIEEEIYQEIQNDEWMPKDLVGNETIYNKAKEAHHH